MSSKSVAVAYALLMFTSALPLAQATHIDSLTPDVPVLPHAEPEQECLPSDLDEEILARANRLAGGDPTWYRDELGVPALCIAGGPVPEWVSLITQLDAVLDNLRNSSAEVQRQVDIRLEHTLPPSDYPNELVEPRTVLLDERFDGRRYTGFGDWKVVTEKGEDEVFRIESTVTVNGTRSVYRFGDADGYERGAHQWLISPEIDLTAVKGNETAVQTLTLLRTEARERIWKICNTFRPPGPDAPPGQGQFAQVCGEGKPGTPIMNGVTIPNLGAVVEAYQMAVDQTVYQLPVMHHAAFMDITYRLNMAPSEDGVRVWVYTGDRAPDRRVLYNEFFGRGDAYEACVHHVKPAGSDLPPEAWNSPNETVTTLEYTNAATCETELNGGRPLSFDNMSSTQAFKTGVIRKDASDAFTGNISEFRTARVNLTEYIGDRIWLLFEVKTLPNDRGVDIFSDTSRFGRQRDFGFELGRVYVEGDGYHRNLRLKDVAANLDLVSPDNDEGDTRNVKIAIPPGNEPVTVWVHNAGDYVENASLVIRANTNPSHRVELREILPDEVRAVKVPWGNLTNGAPLRNKTVYHLNASIQFIQNSTPTLFEISQEPTSTLDPNATAVRPQNAPSIFPEAGVTSLYQPVRADTVRNLTLLRADGARGNPVQLCSSVIAGDCQEHYAGRKGEERTILVGIRNDGNAPQDASVTLKLELDGVERPDMVVGGPVRAAPDLLVGEVRSLQWSIIPTLPGSYRVILVPQREGDTQVRDRLAERLMFVQRSTGLICLDTLQERECGPTYDGDFVPALRDEDVTASAIGADGTLYVATRTLEAVGDIHSGQLAARDPTTGVWRILANLSATVLNETFPDGPTVNFFSDPEFFNEERNDHAWGSVRAILPGPRGELYLFGDNSTTLLWKEGEGLTQPLSWYKAVQFTDGMFHNNTLLAVGSNGQLIAQDNFDFWEKIVFASSATFWITDVHPNGTLGTFRYNGTFHDLAVGPNGGLVLVGSDGVFLRHSGNMSFTANTTWRQSDMDGELLHWAVENRTLRTAVAHQGRLYIGGDNSTLLVSTNAAMTEFERVTAPPPVYQNESVRSFIQLFVSEGRLQVLASDGTVASCGRCTDEIVAWEFESLPLPAYVPLVGSTHIPQVQRIVDDATRTIVLAEGGLVMDRIDVGDYTNLLSWTTVPSLAPRDGGVIQTLRSDAYAQDAAQYSQSYYGLPNPAGREVANRAESYRLFLNHSVVNATPSSPVRVGLIYRPIVDVHITDSGGPRTCQLPPPNPSAPAGASTIGTSLVCYNNTVRYEIDRFIDPTDTDTWVFEAYDRLPTQNQVGQVLGGNDPLGLFLYGVELWQESGARWIVDDVRLEGFVDGAWKPIVLWRGPGIDPECVDCLWYHGDLQEFLFLNGVPREVGTTKVTVSRIEDEPQWEQWPYAMDLQTNNTLWHYTTQWADRPVFAANDEFFAGATPSEPFLRTNGSSRLLSPVIDLADAYDPQLVFRHLYAFRTEVYATNNGDAFNVGDGGTIEVQYELRGEDCGSTDDAVTCGWSRFYTVQPDGGYPTKEEMGYADELWVEKPTAERAQAGRLGPERSFFGRLIGPDDTGVISGTRDTSRYEEVRVTLANAECDQIDILALEDANPLNNMVDCVYSWDRGQATPVNLTSRKVRFAFHLHTVTYRHGSATAEDKWEELVGNRTFPGEGWYITDVSLRGASKLGIDLVATNLTPRVGYDYETIGVGPGTRVPLEVRVENRGVFDALGYTGKLQIRRVLDRALGITELVDTINLAQQPVLDAGGNATHTIFWSVPTNESAEYALSFEVTPIGIARDESFLDNVATLGSTTAPILAKTVRRFNPEFLVSPENATVDITRYLPMFINNTGNVPLEGFTVERRITQIGVSVNGEARDCAEWRQFRVQGRQTAIVDCRVWMTDRPAPEGARTPLTLLSEQVDATADLFWKAPARASYLVSLGAKTSVGSEIMTGGADKRISAFATYLFDDVESGTRGDAITGTWVYGPGWNVSQPGFRSSDSYGFGDATLGRYAPDADDSLVTPTLEIGNARTARVAFYHKYDLEPSFDGGLIEASADGGKTWSILSPIADDVASAAYDLDLPLQAASALHPTGDPADVTYGFTGNSSSEEAAVDGWVLSQIDLTSYGNVTEPRATYEAYGSIELGGLDKVDNATRIATGLYRGNNWCENAEEFVCWEVQNLTEGIRSPAEPAGKTDHTFWWSGSPTMEDDSRRPLQNYMLEFKLDISTLEPGERVKAEWWEYASRFGTRSHVLPVGPPQGKTPEPVPSEDAVYSAHTFLPASRPGVTWRFNLGEPKIVETQGHWYRMEADLTELVEKARTEDGKTELPVMFAYTPLKQYSARINDNAQSAATLANYTTAGDASDYFGADVTHAEHPHLGRYGNDSGFALDGLKVARVREARGAVVSSNDILVDADPAIYECGVGADAGTTSSNATDPNNAWGKGGTNAAACMDRNKALIKNTPNEKFNATGFMWSRVSELPGINSTGWQVVSVRDHRDATKLSTGEPTWAWWTGDIACRRDVNVTDHRCPEPGSEARLVTPAIDLGKIAGDNAAFTFWHRYGFYSFTTTYGGLPLSSGGVVEIQEYDPQTGAWSPWKQLYASKDLTPGHAEPTKTVRDGSRGGYSGVTSNVSYSSLGVLRYDAPFETHRVEGSPYEYQYLYTGNSMWLEGNTTQEGAAVDGWMEETFDVKEYLGKRVRFGFHYAISDYPANVQDDARGSINDPEDDRDDSDETTAKARWANDRSGWWISDMRIVGDVLVGQPIQLRFRAGSDGNVHDGGWLLDDIGVFGSRYRENVGLFVDTTPGKYGAMSNSETVIPLTIRNLGESVRRDLAIEVIKAGVTPVQLHASAPKGNETIDGSYILKGFTLSPGQSTTIDLRVRTPNLGNEPNVKLIFRLKEESLTATGKDRFALITDNEVQGLLQREVVFELQRTPRAEILSSTIRQVTPRVGETVEMELVIRNPGYGPVRLNMTCVAQTVTEYADTVHATPNGVDTPIVAETYPCNREGSLNISAKGTETFVLRATPTKAGFLSFRILTNVFGGDNLSRTAGTMVGGSPFTWTQSFDRSVDVSANFTDGDTPGVYWSHLRGNDAPGALLLGIDENDSQTEPGYLVGPNNNGFDGGCGAPGYCLARSSVVDLHNYSVGAPAFLSFWHMDRLAKHDGAQLRARILLDEQHGNIPPDAQAGYWTEPCILRPIGGYEGRIRQIPPQILPPGSTITPDPGDPNGVFRDGDIYGSRALITPVDFFVSDNGRWEETWELAVFDLAQSCQPVAADGQPITLVGKSVIFELMVFTGQFTAGDLRRGLGHGMLVDDMVVSPYALSVRPAEGQRAAMLDNTTKSFNVIVKNLGATPDVVRLEYDAANSSAPEGSIELPVDAYVLAPGESRVLTARVTLPRDPSLLPTEFKARVLARSTIDRNAVGATVLDLAFGPRPWPELALTVDAPSGVIQEGTEAFISLTVENVGLVESVATRVRITDTWDGGSETYDLDLASIPSYQQDAIGSVRQLEFRWRPEEGSVGPHTLTFDVDPDVLGEEYTRTNNRVTLTVPVSDLLIPDLALDNFSALTLRNAAGGFVSPAIDADVARYEITAGEIVSFDVKVRNPGRAGATNVDVRAFLGSLSLPPKQIPYIAPGSEVVVTFVWLAQKGEYEIEFLARSEQVELSVDNNRYPGVGVTLLTVKGYEVEVAIPAIAALLEPGTEVSFPFSISNTGNAGEDLLLRATSPAGTRVLLPREGFFLRPGETYEAEARLLLDAEAVAGEQFISIDAVARENPMKVASGRAAMRVNASYGGSVEGGVGLGAPTEIELPIELTNEGNSLEPWLLRAALPAGWSTKEKLPMNVSVPAHDRKTVTLHVIVPATTAPGDRTFRVSALMPNGESRESTARVQVSPLRTAGVTVQDETPTPERGTLRIPIEVENKGNVKQPFSVVMTDVPAGVEVRVSQDVFDLAPGEKVLAALVVKPNENVTAGTYALTGYTRFEGVVAATSEGLANVQVLRVPIVRQDIALGAIESTPRAGVQPGDRVVVKVPVHNRGLAAVTDVPVHLFLDDVFIAEMLLPAIGPGARVDATFNWTAVEGVHTLTAVVDPYEDTVDADREDNAVSQLATVGNAIDANGGVAAGRADTPGLGLVGLLAALAVGVLLTRGNGSRRQRR